MSKKSKVWLGFFFFEQSNSSVNFSILKISRMLVIIAKSFTTLDTSTRYAVVVPVPVLLWNYLN